MYRCLGSCATTSTRPNEGRDNDGLRIDQLKIALKTIGFLKQHVAQILVIAILHLGSLEFTIDRHQNENAVIVHNTDLLDIVADSLGIQPAALKAALSSSSLCLAERTY